jgi:hypothetical protein
LSTSLGILRSEDEEELLEMVAADDLLWSSNFENSVNGMSIKLLLVLIQSY